MHYTHAFIGIVMLSTLCGCGLQRNLTLPKTPPQTAAQAQSGAVTPAAAGPAQAATSPATTSAPAGTNDPDEVPPSRSFMIQPNVILPLAPAMLSAPSR